MVQGSARQVLNLKTRVRFPVPLPTLPKRFIRARLIACLRLAPNLSQTIEQTVLKPHVAENNRGPLVLFPDNPRTIPQLSWGIVKTKKTKRITGGITKEDRTEIWIQSNDRTKSFRGRHFEVMAQKNSKFTPCASTFRIPLVSTAVADPKFLPSHQGRCAAAPVLPSPAICYRYAHA
jgi:hypothetical protein